ncbi:uncharacterized protein LOC116350195 [Contarinia nasturtii]|uniref:uncharacterized protein LOC116350195 n=1 Tax=Contarinia nasturtii TaxID=265458 RepID=UPI0012D4B4DA|nr:uncharacterized protein LOC116350195 [Contarinia nasturtii]
MKTYNKETGSTTMTDLDFEKIKHEFSFYGSQLKKIRETVEKGNPKDDNIEKVHKYCNDILQNLIAMKAVKQQHNLWSTLAHQKRHIDWKMLVTSKPTERPTHNLFVMRKPDCMIYS